MQITVWLSFIFTIYFADYNTNIFHLFYLLCKLRNIDCINFESLHFIWIVIGPSHVHYTTFYHIFSQANDIIISFSSHLSPCRLQDYHIHDILLLADYNFFPFYLVADYNIIIFITYIPLQIIWRQQHTFLISSFYLLIGSGQWYLHCNGFYYIYPLADYMVLLFASFYLLADYTASTASVLVSNMSTTIAFITSTPLMITWFFHLHLFYLLADYTASTASILVNNMSTTIAFITCIPMRITWFFH